MKKIIFKILGELKVYKKHLVIVIVFGIIQALCIASYGTLLKELGDGLQSENLEAVKKAPIILIVLSLMASISRYFHIFNMNYVAELYTVDLRKRLQQKFMNLNLTFHNTYHSGSGGLISRILNDIVIIKDGLRLFADLFRSPVLFVALVIKLLFLDWQLTLTIFIVLPFILAMLRQIGKSLRKYGERNQIQLEKITSTIKESLDGIRIIQSFTLEKKMRDKFEGEANEFLQGRKKFHSRAEMSGPITEFIASVVLVSILIYFTNKIVNQQATFGTLLGMLTFLLLLSEPIKKMQEAYVKLQETVVAATRVFALLDEKSEVPQIATPHPFNTDWKKIEYKNVSFAYGNEMILQNFSLTIKRGEMVAFVGESGSGKSTVVNLLERFFDPTSGQILIDDVPIQNFSLSDLRKNIGLVSQDVFLFSDSIENNIAGSLNKDIEKVQEAAQKANAHNFIMKMPDQYKSRVGERGALLSGGERQRISIARAFYKNADILILDEATSALDTASEIEVQKGLDILMKNKTTLVIAHRLSTIQNADRIVVIKKGQITEVGSHQELLKNGGIYSQLAGLQ